MINFRDHFNLTTKLHYSFIIFLSLYYINDITLREELNLPKKKKEKRCLFLTKKKHTLQPRLELSNDEIYLLVVDGRGGHKQAGESGHSGVDRAPFTKTAGLTILHRTLAGHCDEERRGLGRKSVVIRFRPLRS